MPQSSPRSLGITSPSRFTWSARKRPRLSLLRPNNADSRISWFPAPVPIVSFSVWFLFKNTFEIDMQEKFLQTSHPELSHRAWCVRPWCPRLKRGQSLGWAVLLASCSLSPALWIHNLMFLCIHHLKKPDSDLRAFLRYPEHKGARKPSWRIAASVSKLPSDIGEKRQKNIPPLQFPNWADLLIPGLNFRTLLFRQEGLNHAWPEIIF